MVNILITFPNGKTFSVPAEIVAELRTEYYSNVDDFKRGSTAWDEEFAQSMEPYELKDWLQNNMNWEDIEPHTTLIESGDSCSKMWPDAEIVIK